MISASNIWSTYNSSFLGIWISTLLLLLHSLWRLAWKILPWNITLKHQSTTFFDHKHFILKQVRSFWIFFQFPRLLCVCFHDIFSFIKKYWWNYFYFVVSRSAITTKKPIFCRYDKTQKPQHVPKRILEVLFNEETTRHKVKLVKINSFQTPLSWNKKYYQINLMLNFVKYK
jgi:hypothetical protein